MGIIKEIFSGGVSRPDLKADFVRVPAARPDGATEKAFDPNQHRGQPGNAGQFGPGGGGSASAASSPAAPKPTSNHVAESVAHRVADKIAAKKTISQTDHDAITNAVQHLDRKQLDAVIAKIGLPPVQGQGGGRTSAILGAVTAHAANNPHPAPATGKPIDIKTAKPVDYSGKTASQIPGWDGMSEVPTNMQSYGAVMMRNDPQTGKPQVMLREPTNHYGGYAWTWPQGRPDGDHDLPADAAHREVGEETGLSGHIIGHIPQTFSQVFSHGDHIENAYFIMRHDGGDPDFRKVDDETNDAQWVDLDDAHTMIAQTTNHAGRQRDIKVLDAVRQMVGAKAAIVGGQVAKDWQEDKHPRADDGKFGHGGGGDHAGTGDHASSAAADYRANGVRSKAFKAWFRKSKIVDASGEPEQTHKTDGTGEPLKVFHGTSVPFEQFSLHKTGTNSDSGFLGQGFYFTNDEKVADYYSKMKRSGSPTVIPVYLSAQNPFDWGEKTLGVRGLVKRGERLPEEIHDAVIRKTGFKFDAKSKTTVQDEKMLSEAVRDELLRLGYDGVVASIGKSGAKEYVVFHPEQIKSVDNDGTFDPKSPLIKKDWEESKHPRAEDGKFGHGSGNHASHGGDSSEKPSASSSAKSGEHPHIRTPEFKSWFGDWENDPASASKVVDADGVPQEQHEMPKPVYHGRGVHFDEFDKAKMGSLGAVTGLGFYFTDNREIANEYMLEHGDPDNPDEGTSGPNVLEAFLSIKKPLDFSEPIGSIKFDDWKKAAESLPLAGPHNRTVLNKETGKFELKPPPPIDWAKFNWDHLEELAGREDRMVPHDVAPEKANVSDFYYGLSEAFGRHQVNDIVKAMGYDGLTYPAGDIIGHPVGHANFTATHDEHVWKKPENFGRVWVAFEPTQIKSVDNEGTYKPDNPNMKKSLGRMVEKGFTGVVTASNGAVYHYVDGKRVASAQHYQAHLQANPHAVPPPGPGAAGSNQAAAKAAVADVVNKLKSGQTSLTNQEIGDLVHHFQHLNLAETHAVKVSLGLPKMRGMGGGKNLADHVAQILDHVITHPLTQGSTNAGTTPAVPSTPTPPAPSQAPASAPSQAPAAASPAAQSSAQPPPLPSQSAIISVGHGSPQAIAGLLHPFADHPAELAAVVNMLTPQQTIAVATHLGVRTIGPGGMQRLYSDIDKDIVAAVSAGKASPAPQPSTATPPSPPTPTPSPAVNHQNNVHQVLSDLKSGATPTAADIAAATAGIQHLTGFQMRMAAAYAGIASQGASGWPSRSELAADLEAHIGGFTGQITASNGVVYHYQNGKRVAGPQAATAAPTTASPDQAINDAIHGKYTPANKQQVHDAAMDAIDKLSPLELTGLRKHLGLGANTPIDLVRHSFAVHINYTGKVTDSTGAVSDYQNGTLQQPTPPASTNKPAHVQHAESLIDQHKQGRPLSLIDLQALDASLQKMSPSELNDAGTLLGIPHSQRRANTASNQAAIDHVLNEMSPPLATAINQVKASGGAQHQNAMDSISALSGSALDNMKDVFGLPRSSGVSEVRDAMAKHIGFHGITEDLNRQAFAYVHGQPLQVKTSHAVLTPIIQKVMTGQTVSASEQSAFDAALLTMSRKDLDTAIADFGLPPIPTGQGGRTSILKNHLGSYTGNRPSSNPASVTPSGPPAPNMVPVPSSLGPTPIPPLPPPPPAPPAFSGGTLPTGVSGSNAHRGKLMELVQNYLTQTGQTAEQVLNSGSTRSVARAISGSLASRNAPSAFDIERAVKSVHALNADKVLAPLFLGNSSRNGPNHSVSDEARPSLGTPEKVAAQKYSVTAIAWALNSQLRETGTPPADLAGMHRDLQSAFAQAKVLSTPITCNREMTLSKAQTANLVKLATAAQANGGSLMLPGYTSTTTGASANSFFTGNVRMEIKATHGLDMDPMSHYPSANEFLLNHASQFKVTGVTVSGGKTIIQMEQVPPDKATPMTAHDQAPAGTTAWAKGVWAQKKAKKAKATTATAAGGAFKSFASPQDSQAVKDYISGVTSHRLTHNTAGQGEDTLLTPIMNDSGKGAVPQLLDRAGIDALKAQGWTIGYRGVSLHAGTDQFKSDPTMWNGSGMYGNGTYVCFASGGHMKGKPHIDESKAKPHANGYGQHVMRIAIPPTAKKISVGQIRNKRKAVEAKIDADVTAGSLTHGEGRKLKEVCRDNGRLAALLGYDVIIAGGSSYNYCVVLNRAMLAVQRSNV